MMKNKPIVIQILFAIVIFVAILLMAISICLPIELKKFFTNEAFETIRLSQNLFASRFERNYFKDFLQDDLMLDIDDDNLRKVNHIVIYGDTLYLSKYPEVDILNKIIEEGKQQAEKTKKYSLETAYGDMFYIISKIKVFERDSLIISYLADSYRDSLSKILFQKIIIISIISILIAWVPAFIIAKKISNPIEILEKNVQIISKDLSEEVVILNRNDEIGRLSQAIEDLRVELIRKDDVEKTFIQNVSHELKTPVMVIESYTEAMKDKVYPKGDLDGSIETILDESRLLRDKISNLLMYNKLEYMKGAKLSKEFIRIDQMIEENLSRIMINRNDIKVIKNLNHIEFRANKESFNSLLENLLDNQFRYAKNYIKIECFEANGVIYISFYNDGPEIEGDLSKLFERFVKGKDGKFGLGLPIVKNVCDSEGFDISIENKNGVKFILSKSKDV